jgi:hypothetical protein
MIMLSTKDPVANGRKAVSGITTLSGPCNYRLGRASALMATTAILLLMGGLAITKIIMPNAAMEEIAASQATETDQPFPVEEVVNQSKEMDSIPAALRLSFLVTLEPETPVVAPLEMAAASTNTDPLIDTVAEDAVTAVEHPNVTSVEDPLVAMHDIEVRTLPLAMPEPLDTGLTGTGDGDISLASISLLGWSDRETLEAWLAQGLIALTIETPRGLVVAAVPAPLQPGVDVYSALLMQRPGQWDGQPLGDPRSALEIAHVDQIPLSKSRLESFLEMQTGIPSITHIIVSLSNRAAAMVVLANNARLAQLTDAGILHGTDLSDIQMIMCLNASGATIQQVMINGARSPETNRQSCGNLLP